MSAIGNYVFLTAENYTIGGGGRTPSYANFHKSIEAVHQKINSDLGRRNDVRLAEALETKYNEVFETLQNNRSFTTDDNKELFQSDLTKFINDTMNSFIRGAFSPDSKNPNDSLRWSTWNDKTLRGAFKARGNVAQGNIKYMYNVLTSAGEKAIEGMKDLYDKLNKEWASKSLIESLKKGQEKLRKALEILKAESGQTHVVTDKQLTQFKKVYKSVYDNLVSYQRQQVQGAMGEALAMSSIYFGGQGVDLMANKTLERNIDKAFFNKSFSKESNVQAIPELNQLDGEVFKATGINSENATKVKTNVTFEINIDGVKRRANLSVKNYIMEKVGDNVIHAQNAISLVSGSNFLYMIQNENKNNFVNHWMNATQRFYTYKVKTKDGKLVNRYKGVGLSAQSGAIIAARKEAHRTMKQLLAWKALTGAGLYSKSSSTAKQNADANLLMISDATGKHGVKVFTMKQVYDAVFGDDFQGSIKGYKFDGTSESPWGKSYSINQIQRQGAEFPREKGNKYMGYKRIARMLRIMAQQKLDIHIKAAALSWKHSNSR